MGGWRDGREDGWVGSWGKGREELILIIILLGFVF